MTKYDCSVNCIAWAPPEYGIMLIAGLSSGNIAVINYVPHAEQWAQTILQAHESSVNAISICKLSKSLDLHCNLTMIFVQNLLPKKMVLHLSKPIFSI